MEKKILDGIIGQGKYDSRIRPSGANSTNDAGQLSLHLFMTLPLTLKSLASSPTHYLAWIECRS